MLRAPTRRGQLSLLISALLIVSAAGCDTRPLEATAGTSTSDASLTALVITPGTLAPHFNRDSTSYSVAETNDVTTVTVTPTSGDPDATITVDGGPVLSGAESAAIPLIVGTNNITVTVTATDGTSTRSYSVAAVRAP